MPVYNSEKNLSACVDSVLSQTYEDFELILVDDGSTDSSPAICDEYASRDSRVRVIHKTNGGVSSARNAGLTFLQGRGFVFFSDSDDTLESNALQIMYQAVDWENVDMLIAGYNIYDENGERVSSMEKGRVKLISRDSALEEMFSPKEHRYQGYLWNKLFRKENILEARLRFDERIAFNEDRLFITQYLCTSKNDVAYTTTPVYNYVLRSSGAMGSLKIGYNPLYVSEFDAFISIKKAIFGYTSHVRIRKLAIHAICESYYNIHKSMIIHNRYNPQTHSRMLSELTKNNALVEYFSIMFRPMVIRFLLLVCPKVLLDLQRNRSLC